MTDEQLESFIASALDELARKDAAANVEFSLRQSTGTSYDTDRQVLEFENLSRRVYLVAHVTYIGTYAEHLNSWRWAWANEGFTESARLEARQLKALATITGRDMFCQEYIDDVLPSMTWKLTALAVQHLGALGSYRYESKPQVFVAINTFRRVLQ